MENNLVEKKSNVPGFGVSGIVMCPFGFQKSPCLKSGCELWVELTYAKGTPDEHKVARCAISWIPMLSPEIRTAIEKLSGAQPIKDQKEEQNVK